MQHDPQRASARYTSTEAERLLRQRAALADFGAAALASTDLDGVLAEGARLCAEGMGVPYCKVLEYHPGTDDLIVRAGVGWRPDMIGRAVARVDDGNPGGRAFRTGRPVIVADLRRAEGMDPPHHVAVLMATSRAARAGATAARRSWRASALPPRALLRHARPSGPAPGGPEPWWRRE